MLSEGAADGGLQVNCGVVERSNQLLRPTLSANISAIGLINEGGEEMVQDPGISFSQPIVHEVASADSIVALSVTLPLKTTPYVNDRSWDEIRLSGSSDNTVKATRLSKAIERGIYAERD